ncbi:unnamed protein product [Rodentolepis nana]|uniref:Tetraspanin n=1 Tax=Rodentolepis nana TaxID=102285 RepID=A0A0R3TYM7_RODNA|nr:unnamed protein product [Rodentolepis nana]
MELKPPKPVSSILLRFLLFSSSSFVMFCGIDLTFFGFYFIYNAAGIGVDRSFLFLPGYILVLGVGVTIVGGIGIVCVFCRAKCLIGVFIALMVLIIVCQVIGGSVILALSEYLANLAVEAVRIKASVVNATLHPSQESKAFRSFQISMGCCGFDGPSEYGNKTKEQCCVEGDCTEVPQKLADLAVEAVRIKALVVVNGTLHPSQESKAFRSFQISMGCCGFDGPSDYGNKTMEQCCVEGDRTEVPQKVNIT